jgi:hypothetical protein
LEICKKSIFSLVVMGWVMATGHGLWGAVEPCVPVTLTAEQDHTRMMNLLGITSLRPWVDGMNPSAPNRPNYDEAQANPYPRLPDAFLTQQGKRITTPDQWWAIRRPQIVEDFDREIYGRVPGNLPSVTWKVESSGEGEKAGVPVLTRVLVGHVDNSACPALSVDIEATLITPRQAKGPVPVVLQLCGGFFYKAKDKNGNVPKWLTWQDLALAKGWACCELNTDTIQADNGAGLTQGIIGLANRGQPRSPEDWGALRAWAWGAARLLDYFETDPALDAKRVAVEGHSRWGKAALVTMAYDQRFAAAYVSSSGEGGAKLHRRNFGEPVENIASSGEYHWMAGNFLKYAGPLTWGDLPVDAHELIALCASRPVFISAGNGGDTWVDARGMFMAAVAAQEVYEFMGKKGMGTDQMPPIGMGLLDGDIAFRQHNEGHTDGPNWPFFLDFAQRHFKAQTTP